MKKTKAQRKADAAFIQKIKSISVSISGKALGDIPCPACGDPLSEHGDLEVEVKVKGPYPAPPGFFESLRNNPTNN